MSFLADLKKAPPLGKTVALISATLGITYGYDISNIAGALLFIPNDFPMGESGLAAMATAVVIGQIMGALAGSVMANKIGRKRSMLLIAAGYAVFAVLSMLSPTAVLLFLFRTLLGLTIGLSVSIVPVFIAEAAPTAIRGGLATSYQVACVFGIILGYVVAWLLSPTESWRYMLGAAAIPSIIVFLLLFRLTETPNFLLMKGKETEALNVLSNIEGDEEIVQHRLESIKQSLAEEAGQGHFKEMLSGHLLKATLFAVGLGFFIQITGINATIYYAPKIFEQMGFEGLGQQLLLPAVVQAFSLVAVVASMVLIDKLGRRPILLTGIGVMIFANILLVIVYSVGGGFSGIGEYVGLFAIIIFTMGYTYGFGALVWVYAGEIFPSRFRAAGASVMLTSDLVANAIVAQAFPPLLTAIGGTGVFLIFGILCVLAFLFVYRLAPETKGRDLEDIASYWANGARWPSA